MQLVNDDAKAHQWGKIAVESVRGAAPESSGDAAVEIHHSSFYGFQSKTFRRT